MRKRVEETLKQIELKPIARLNRQTQKLAQGLDARHVRWQKALAAKEAHSGLSQP
jgi:hypothetical protein